MRIALVTNLYFPYEIGGAEIYVRQLAQELAVEHDVTVITSEPFSLRHLINPKKEHDGNIRVYRFSIFNIASVNRLRSLHPLVKPIWHALDLWNVHTFIVMLYLLRRIRPNILHTHNISGLSPAVFSAARVANIPVIHTLHDYHLLSPWSILYRNNRIITHFSVPERVYQMAKRAGTGAIQTATAPSQFVLDYHRHYGFFRNSRTVHVPLGIRIPNNETTQSPTRSDGTFVILYIGQITDYKGVSILIRAFRRLDLAGLCLSIAGTGPDLASCKEEAAGDSRIIFHGFVREDAKQQLFQKAAFSVVPSVWYDNSPVAIYESFMQRLPVVASAIGGIPELVRDGQNGLLFSAGDVDALAGCIRRLYENRAMLQHLRENTSADILRYSFDHHLRQLETLYKELL